MQRSSNAPWEDRPATAGSPFVDVPPSEHNAGNRSAFAIYDRFPVGDGHALVISRRLVADWWQATPDERAGLCELVVDDPRRAEELGGGDGR